MNHEIFMRRVLELASKGIGAVSPNPRVGAVIVNDNRIVAEGYHTAFGKAHAEIEALRQIPVSRKSSLTLYVNLEPCSHHGKTPPCTEAIIEAGIETVVYGIQDPNPKVSGQGIARLKAAGVRVIGPVLETDCMTINAGFIKSIVTKTPWITLKIAQTVDGRIALANGQSQWITSQESRALVHVYRSRYDAVLVGVGTILQDNPSLNARIPDGTNPKRIILDSDLRTPDESRILHENPELTTLITSEKTENERIQKFRDQGIHVLTAPCNQGRLQISALWKELISSGVCSILVEGGEKIFSFFLKSGLADQVLIFIAPKIFGQGIPSVNGFEISQPEEALSFSSHRWSQTGPDILLEGTITCLQDLLKN